MLIYYDGSVFRYVPCDLFRSLFIDEATKTSNVYVFSISHGAFYDRKECLYCGLNIRFIDSGFF